MQAASPVVQSRRSACGLAASVCLSSTTTGPLTRSREDTEGAATERSPRVLVYTDKILVCADCNQQFVFTASEQDFYAQRGFSDPKRCGPCRNARKASRPEGGSHSGGFGGGNFD